MRTSRVTLSVLSAAVLLALPTPATGQAAPISSELLQELRFRPVGPAVTGGRIHDVEALPHDPSPI